MAQQIPKGSSPANPIRLSLIFKKDFRSFLQVLVPMRVIIHSLISPFPYRSYHELTVVFRFVTPSRSGWVHCDLLTCGTSKRNTRTDPYDIYSYANIFESPHDANRRNRGRVEEMVAFVEWRDIARIIQGLRVDDDDDLLRFKECCTESTKNAEAEYIL
ncbi:hypothetical protein BJ165DRAFT_1118592 [Panaeolus papilionaceus]|nr:hypothetical protein BJ165DRAFT_1118592 [Panaeolus papilionaceus]